jgi:hypothetical protein
MLKQSIDTTKDISLEIMSTYCSIDNKLANEHFSRLAKLYPLLDDYSTLVKHLKQTKCAVPAELVADEINNIFINWLHVGNYEYLKKFHREFSSLNKNIQTLYFNHLKNHLWQALTLNDLSQGLELLAELKTLSSDKVIDDEIKHIESTVTELIKMKSLKPESFIFLAEQKTLNEDKLMENLNLAIENLNQVKTISDNLIASKIPEIINFASSELAQYYFEQAHIFKTIRINHADIDYLKSFYEQMTSLASSTSKTAQKYLDKNISFIQKNNILSISNQRLYTTSNHQSLLQEINFKPYLAAVDK